MSEGGNPAWNVERPAISKGAAVIDFHTHTYFSGDSSTTIDQYVDGFNDSGLTHVCVTDHNSISAVEILKQRLGNAVICGQELRVREGEIIGLFLKERIPAGLSINKAAGLIHEQGGIVYLCHPMDNIRVSLSENDIIVSIEAGSIDTIEIYNSKSQFINHRVIEIAKKYHLPMLAGSDSHVASSIGAAGSVLPKFDSVDDLKNSLDNSKPFGKYCDPTRRWTNTIIPATAH